LPAEKGFSTRPRAARRRQVEARAGLGGGVQPRLEELRERHVAVVTHDGPLETIDETRRPLYRHMILHELVGGPSIVRFPVGARASGPVDALVMTHAGFDGDDLARVETLPAGTYAVLDYEGPPSGLAAAREGLLAWVRAEGHAALGPLLQVHHMDPVDGIIEEQLQVPVRPSATPPRSLP
jgi:effector-binding domain-containing protein